jgi:hypothetical protein
LKKVKFQLNNIFKKKCKFHEFLFQNLAALKKKISTLISMAAEDQLSEGQETSK